MVYSSTDDIRARRAALRARQAKVARFWSAIGVVLVALAILAVLAWVGLLVWLILAAIHYLSHH